MKCSRANNKHSHFLHKKGRLFDIKHVRCFHKRKATNIRISQKSHYDTRTRIVWIQFHQQIRSLNGCTKTLSNIFGTFYLEPASWQRKQEMVQK
ncbi:MAG: hypothetical protein CW716_12575 [Candidatus Bathyarchaeum sp.]|nr:MAG: hypothetical protein CW716_12575 [Candidatus Bathyarchaeum sp.]